MARILRDVAAMQDTSRALRKEGQRIAVVPTMGALHEGHLSLIRLAASLADSVIATIFVNPTQFAPGEDLDRYPRPFDRDVALASDAGAGYIFAPTVEVMYPSAFATSVSVEGLTSVLEGASRPTHFRGVTTVVTKLFECTLPDVAVFGQKDGQQVAVIRRLVKDLNIPVEIVVGPIIREPDGLAMSSRNVFLTPRERAQAPALHRALVLGEEMMHAGERASEVIISRMKALIGAESEGAIDYVSVADAESLEEQNVLASGRRVMVSLAVRFGTTRLIDNIVTDVP